MLTALSMEDASRTATGDAREYRNQGTYIPLACESRGRRSPQETKTRTARVRQQLPASPAQRDWAGRIPSFSSHAQTRSQTVGSGRDVTPDPLPRHAHEPSAWAKTNRETNQRRSRRPHCSNHNARGSTGGTTEKTRTHRDNFNYGESTGYGREYRRRRLGPWGEVDKDDECSGVEYVLKKRPADGNRRVWSHTRVSNPLPFDNQPHATPIYHNLENQDASSNRKYYEHTDNHNGEWKNLNLNRKKTGKKHKRKNQKKIDSTLGYPGEGPERLRMATFNVRGLKGKADGINKMRKLLK